MKVLHVHSGNLYGGVETFLLGLCSKACPFESSFALTHGGRFEEELRQRGVAVSRLPTARIRNPRALVRARSELSALLQRDAFDAVVVHSGWSHALFGGVATAQGIPLVTFLHGPVAGSWIDRLAALVRPALVVCNSRYTASSAESRFGNVPIRVSHLSHPPEMPRVGAETRAALRAELGVNEGAVLILQVSRMEPWKGQLLHLQALAQLRATEGWHAVFVGGAQRPQEQSFLESLRHAARELGIHDRVTFAGERRDVPQLMSSADLYCQPNTGPEPFGLTLLEAMLYGLPVVTSAMGGALEIVDMSCGRLVSPSATDVARELRMLIGDEALRRQLGESGRCRARDTFAPAMRMEELALILSQAVQARLPTAGAMV